MPPVEDRSEEDITEETKGTASKPIIGIIYPPPEVRNIVDKTAGFVARNGPEFESRIRDNEINNPKFNFLNPQDPYHAYYQHKVKDFKEGKGQEPAAPKGPPSMFQAPMQKLQEQTKIIETIIPKDPPVEYEFIADPPSISAFDLDVVKLTAQFVARNGRQFLTNLMNREQRNYQFDFLRPQHSLFNYFTKLVEQYTKILIPPKDQLAKLRKESDDCRTILDQVKYRVEWAKYQERERQKEEEMKERERVAYASIDWHDFVVVETVDFQHSETGNLPPPTTPEEVGARVIAQERFQGGPADSEAVEMEVASSDEEEEEAGSPEGVEHAPDDIQVQDMEEESDEEGEEDHAPRDVVPPPPAPVPPPPPPSEAPQPPPLPPALDQVIIKKDYDPKAPKTSDNEPAPDKFLISPLTGEQIPAHKIQEHMRIGLLDPSWHEKRDRSLPAKREEEVYAPGASIGSSLRQLAERRTDIFGVGVEETQIGKKIGEEERREKKVIWDGHTASMEKVTQKARENISIEEQIAVIHKVKGLVADEEKEKIGPAMPKNTPAMPAPPMPPLSTPKPISAPSKPPLPPPITPKNIPPMSKPPVPPPPRPPTRPMAPPRPPMMMMAPPQPPPMRPMGVPSRPPMPPPMMGMPPQGPPPGGFMPRPPMGRPPMMPPQRPPHHKPPQDMDDEPPSKKAKTEESLMPEHEFLAKNKGPVMFKVQVPNLSDKPEWQLNGQTLNLTLPLTDNVSVIKAKIHESLGMPAGKQKLQFEGLFIKDSNTLAYYNLTRNCNIQLQLKERGGRKK